MSKVTSKLQVTLPKAVAERHGIRPSDEIEWESAGDVIRIVRTSKKTEPRRDREARLRRFDQATRRQASRDASFRKKTGKKTSPPDRGWTREDLYDRGRSR